MAKLRNISQKYFAEKELFLNIFNSFNDLHYYAS